MYYDILYISGTNVTHLSFQVKFDVHNPKTSTKKSNYEPIYRKGFDINKINQVCPEHLKLTTIFSSLYTILTILIPWILFHVAKQEI